MFLSLLMYVPCFLLDSGSCAASQAGWCGLQWIRILNSSRVPQQGRLVFLTCWAVSVFPVSSSALISPAGACPWGDFLRVELWSGKMGRQSDRSEKAHVQGDLAGGMGGGL